MEKSYYDELILNLTDYFNHSIIKDYYKDSTETKNEMQGSAIISEIKRIISMKITEPPINLKKTSRVPVIQSEQPFSEEFLLNAAFGIIMGISKFSQDEYNFQPFLKKIVDDKGRIDTIDKINFVTGVKNTPWFIKVNHSSIPLSIVLNEKGYEYLKANSIQAYEQSRAQTFIDKIGELTVYYHFKFAILSKLECLYLVIPIDNNIYALYNGTVLCRKKILEDGETIKCLVYMNKDHF